MTTLDKRRRAIMSGAGKAPDDVIGVLEPGSKVKLGMYPFIVMEQTENYTIIMRDVALGSRAQSSAVTTNADYDGSPVDTYLTGTYIPSFSQIFKNIMVTAPVVISTNYDGTTGTKTINRNCVVPSQTQMQKSGWLAALKSYYGVTTDNQARIAYNSSGTAVAYWLCNAYPSNSGLYYTISSGGAVGRTAAYGHTYNQRPLIFIDPTAKVIFDGTQYVIQGRDS